MSKKSVRRGLAALAGVAYFALAQAETVRIGGTGAALGSMERLAGELRKRDPSFAFEVLTNLGSGGGVKALAMGALQIAVVSRPLRPDELRPDLRVIEYARTPFVLVTAKTGVSALSAAQVAALYGRQARWPDGTPVRLVLRPAVDVDHSVLAGVSPAMPAVLADALAREGMVVAATDREAADAVERLPGALGTSSLALVISENRRLTPLAIDGVPPSPQTLADGRYPYGKTLALVVPARPTPMTVRFLDFLASADGRRILAETGHQALPAAPAGTVGR